VLQFKTLRDDGPLARFSPAAGRARLKRFSSAMRYNADIFNPETLAVHPAGTWSEVAADAAAAAPAPAPAQQLR